MSTSAAPLPEPLPASSTGNPAGDTAVAAAETGDKFPGSGDLPGSIGQESLAGPRDDEDDEYEPLV